MDSKDALSLAVAIVIAVCGWLAAHILTARRETEQKKRDLRVAQLRQSYLLLVSACDDGGPIQNRLLNVQRALNEIQLFGDERHIEMIAAMVRDMKEHSRMEMTPLLISLRNEIREHLGLPPIYAKRWKIWVSDIQSDEIPFDHVRRVFAGLEPEEAKDMLARATSERRTTPTP